MKKHEDVIVTLISFYLFNGNLLLICHSCCSKSGRFGKMETFTVRRVTRFLVKAWGARGGTPKLCDAKSDYQFIGSLTKFKKLSYRKFLVRALTIFIDTEYQLSDQLIPPMFVPMWTSPAAHERAFLRFDRLAFTR